jgi:catalase
MTSTSLQKGERTMAKKKEKLTTRNGAPVVDNQNTMTPNPAARYYSKMSGFWRS